jgi:glycosyltransferase involved in cell wall biosynthesis
LTGRDRGLVMLCDVDFAFPDGTRTHTVEVARGFAQAGFSVDLVARGPAPNLTGVRYAAADGAEEQRFRRLVTINQRAIGLLWRRRHMSDRFYVRDSWSCFPAILAARMLSYRVVIQVDGIPYGEAVDSGNPLLSLVKRALAIAVGRLSTGQLAVTPEIKRLLVRLARVSPSRVAVIPNGVDLEFFTPIAREEAISRLKLDPDRRYLVFCGGLHPWSDFDGLLEAFAEVHRQRADTFLILVGDGPQRARVEAQATTLGVRDSIRVTGMIADREVVRDYLAAATTTLLAYSADKVGPRGSPIKLTEYLAMGRAVVSFEISGLRELIEDTGAGIVVSGGSAEMASAVLGMLSDGQADRYGAAGRSLAEARLSWKTVIDRTLQLFEDSQDDVPADEVAPPVRRPGRPDRWPAT